MLPGGSGGSKNSLGAVCRSGVKTVCLQCVCVLFCWLLIVYGVLVSIEIVNLAGISSRPGGLQATRP